MKLKSPFNGEVWTVPPDQPPAFVEALIARGFTRVKDEAATPAKQPKEPAHD